MEFNDSPIGTVCEVMYGSKKEDWLWLIKEVYLRAGDGRRTCRDCGEIPVSGRKMYCMDCLKARRREHNRNYAKQGRKYTSCVICGGELAGQKYCAEHQIEMKRKQQAEWRKIHRLETAEKARLRRQLESGKSY